ncbi:MAG: TolC family protein, partial [Proteobacteria bacterium]|nr:TolC family protein [Pseudomonadota bacterium]
MQTSIASRALIPAFLTALAGCSMTVRPDLPAPDRDPVVAATDRSWTGPAAPWPKDRWWASLGDAGLGPVVERALLSNPDLRAAQAHAREAEAIARASGAVRLPAVGASASVARERLSANGLIPPPYGGSTYTTGDVAASLAWKLDLFGAERERSAARGDDAAAAALDAEYARTVTAAAAARLYYELAAALADSTVVESTLEQRRDVLRLTEGRVRAGLDSATALHEAAAQVPALELERAQAQERIAVARAALAALLGAGPDATDALAPDLA